MQRLICARRPEQLKMDFALWSRAAVMQLMERECAVTWHVRSRPASIWRAGDSPRNSRSSAPTSSSLRWYKRGWMSAILLLPPAPRRNRVTFTGVTRLHWSTVRGRSYSPRGHTPVTMAVGGARQKLSMIASVTNQGKARWMIIDGNVDHQKLIEFFEALILDADRKVFLILDNLGVHHCKPVKAWLAERRDKVEVFYLPSYSPELNPEERLNADLKHVIRSKVPIRTKLKLQAATEAYMTLIASTPERVKAYFQDPRVNEAT